MIRQVIGLGLLTLIALMFLFSCPKMAVGQDLSAYDEVVLSPEGIDLSAFKNLSHTKNLIIDMPMTDDEGRKMYFDGTLVLTKNKTQFNAAVNRGVKPEYGSAQCAVTTSSVLETEFNMVGFSHLAIYFNKTRRDKNDTFLSLTHGVEVQLRRLGWNYFLSRQYKAPWGSIGLMADRYWFPTEPPPLGSKSHSGHIYTILVDRWPGRNIIADNGGYNHEYNKDTEGFWLPSGVYPKAR